MNKERFFNWLITKRQLGKNSMRHTRIRYDYIYRWLGNKKLTAKTAETFILSLTERGLRSASINSYIRVINLIDIYHRENGKDYNLLRNISYRKKEKKTPTILSIQEIDALLSIEIPHAIRNGVSQTATKRINDTNTLLLWVLASTGCRFSEATNLQVYDVELGLKDSWVTFRNTKNKHDRKCPIPPVLGLKLKAYLKDRQPQEYVFTTSTGHYMAPQLFMEDLAKRVKISGITGKHIHPHCFRNSFIMEHLRQGTDPITLAKLVGHEDVNSTLGYTKYNQDDLLRGAEKHPFFQRNTSPEQLLEKIKETLHNLAVLHDPRFSYTFTEGGNSLAFNLFIK